MWWNVVPVNSVTVWDYSLPNHKGSTYGLGNCFGNFWNDWNAWSTDFHEPVIRCRAVKLKSALDLRPFRSQIVFDSSLSNLVVHVPCILVRTAQRQARRLLSSSSVFYMSYRVWSKWHCTWVARARQSLARARNEQQQRLTPRKALLHVVGPFLMPQ